MLRPRLYVCTWTVWVRHQYLLGTTLHPACTHITATAGRMAGWLASLLFNPGFISQTCRQSTARPLCWAGSSWECRLLNGASTALLWARQLPCVPLPPGGWWVRQEPPKQGQSNFSCIALNSAPSLPPLQASATVPSPLHMRALLSKHLWTLMLLPLARSSPSCKRGYRHASADAC